MKKLTCFITIFVLVLSMLGNVYAEGTVDEAVPNEVQEALEEPKQETTDVVEKTEDSSTESVENTETEEPEIYSLYELLPFKGYEDWSFTHQFEFGSHLLLNMEEYDLFYEYADKVKLTLYDGVVKEEKNNNHKAYVMGHPEPNKNFQIYFFPEYVKIIDGIADGNFMDEIYFYKYVSGYSNFTDNMKIVADTIYQRRFDEVKKSIVKDESLNDLVFTSTEVRDPYKPFGDVGDLIDTDNAEKIYITNKEGITFRINKDLQRDKLKKIRLGGLPVDYITVKLADETVLYKIDVDDGRQMMYVTEKHVIFRDEELDRTLIFNCESDISLFVNHQVNSRDNDKMIQKLMDLEAIGMEQFRRTETQYYNYDFPFELGEIVYVGIFKAKLDDSYKGTNFYNHADSDNEVEIYIILTERDDIIKVGDKIYEVSNTSYEHKSSFYPWHEIVDGKSLKMDEAETFYIQKLGYNDDYTFFKLRLYIDTQYNVNTRKDPNPVDLICVSQTGYAYRYNSGIGITLDDIDIEIKGLKQAEINENKEEITGKENTEPPKVEQPKESEQLSENQISKLGDSGIMVGDPDGNLRLEDTITRAETVKVLCTATEIETEDSKTDEKFSDVDTNHWAYDYINKAQNINIINGYGDSTFKPENTVTYNEFIKMLVCVTGYGDKAEEKGGYPNGYIAVAEEIGITEGIVFKGDDEITRNDVGIMILNVLNILDM